MRGQLIAELDNAEYRQAVAQAQADLMVAKAYLAEAQNLLTIARRELENRWGQNRLIGKITKKTDLSPFKSSL